MTKPLTQAFTIACAAGALFPFCAVTTAWAQSNATAPSAHDASALSGKAGAGQGKQDRTTLDGTPAVTTAAPQRFVGPTSLKVTIGHAVPDFVLPDAAKGKSVGFSTLAAGKKAVVLLFTSTKCPVSNDYEARVQEIATKFGPQGVAVVGIDANTGETATMITNHATADGLTFPFLRDETGKVADQFHARVTPEAFVIDGGGVLVYRGAIDDNQDTSVVAHRYVVAALDAVLAGKPVAVKTHRAFGCLIKRATAPQ